MVNELWEILSSGLPPRSHLLSNLSSALALSQNQAQSVNSNTAVALCYLVFLLYKPTATRAYAFLAVFSCIIIGYSPLYDSLTNVQYYSLLSLIYAFAAIKTSRFRNVFSVKVATACCIMAAFELAMATDRWINAGIETWTYRNYEAVVVCIHFLILSAGCRWDASAIRRYLEHLSLRLRTVLHVASYNRCL